MKDSWVGQVGIRGCGSPVETSAEGRSTDRAGRRDQRHYRYLKENKPTVVNVMCMNNTLKQYLREVDEQAEEMLFQLVKQMAKDECVDEAMKRRDQLYWVGRMNNIRNRAEEIVLREVICV